MSQSQPAMPPKLPALITGASGGIGADLARVFARNGHDVALVARNQDKLEALAAGLEQQHSINARIVAIDLEKPDAAQALAGKLAASGFKTGILVNNAGFGLNGSFADLALEQQLALIDLNIRSLTQLTSTFLPQIIAARGGVLNVASVASFFPGPGMAAYYASKAYVLSLSEALYFELKDQGVTVSCLCPGPTESDFIVRAGIPDDGKAFYSMASMPVAEAGYNGLMAGRRVVVPGTFNKILRVLSNVVPNRLSMIGVARAQYNRQRKKAEAKAG